MEKLFKKIKLFVGQTKGSLDYFIIIEAGNGLTPFFLLTNRGVSELYTRELKEDIQISSTMKLILRELHTKSIINLEDKIQYFDFSDLSNDLVFGNKVNELLQYNFNTMSKESVEKIIESIPPNVIINDLDLLNTQEESKVTYTHIDNESFVFNEYEQENISKLKHKYGWASLDLNPIGAKSVLEGIKKGKTKNVLITGPTGTGKSFWAARLGVELALPFNSINLYADVTEETLRSSIQPVNSDNNNSINVEDVKNIMRLAIEYQDNEVGFAKEIKALELDKKVNGSKFIRVFSQFAIDYPRPGISAIEEINLASMSLLGYLYSALDHRGELSVGGGITLHRHPWRIIIATMNPVFQGYTGAEPLNKALKSRLSSTIIYDDVNLAEMKERLELDPDIQYKNVKFINKLYDVYTKMKPLINNARRINSHVSYRNIQNLMQHLVINKDLSFSEIFHGEFLNNLLAETNEETKETIRLQSKDWIEELEYLYGHGSFASLEDIELFKEPGAKVPDSIAESADEFSSLLGDYDELFGGK